MPNKGLAPKATKPESIKGSSLAVEMADWEDYSGIIEKAIEKAYGN